MFKEIDLTTGKVWKVITIFSIPIILSYVFQQIYTLTDAAICGQFLEANEVAGVNNTSNITFMVLQFAFGCTAGFSVVTAKKIGAKDIAGARQSFLTQVILSFVISIILTILAILMIDPLLAFIGVREEMNSQIYNAAYTYVFIIFLGIIFQVYYNLACCFMRSLGNSMIPLVFLILSTILNIGLDLLFIAVFKMGVSGAAIATCTAQAIAAISCFVYIYFKYPEYHFKKSDFKIKASFVNSHLVLGLPLAFQYSILTIGLIVMQGTTIKFDILPDGTLGYESQLGYGAACKLNCFLMTPINALGTAMLSYTGQNYGYGDINRIKEGIKQSIYIMLILCLVFAGAGLLLTIDSTYLKFFLSPDKITPLTSKYGNYYLWTILPFYPFLGLLFIVRNVLQGLEKPLWPFIGGINELVARVGICLFIPQLVNGAPIDRNANDLSYIITSSCDVFSWVAAALPLSIALYIFIKKNDRKEDVINENIAY